MSATKRGRRGHDNQTEGEGDEPKLPESALRRSGSVSVDGGDGGRSQAARSVRRISGLIDNDEISLEAVKSSPQYLPKIRIDQGGGARSLKLDVFAPGMLFLNNLLTCSICQQPFRDAVTLPECLHTFCQACLDASLQSARRCPTCKLSLVRPDADPSAPTVLKDPLICQVVSALFPAPESEPAPPSHDAQSRSSAKRARSSSSSAKSSKKRDQTADSQDSVMLEMVSADDLPQLEKPILQISATATVLQIQLFLKLKLKLDSAHQLQLFMGNHLLAPDYTLQYLLSFPGLHDSDNLRIHYRLKPSF